MRGHGSGIEKQARKREDRVVVNQNTSLNNKIWIPGCWEKTNFSNSNYNNVQWRFCGGFVICPSHLVETLCQHNYELFKDACENKNTIWEVNIWSMIEDLLQENSYFHWYKGDHNETILPSWDLIHTL